MTHKQFYEWCKARGACSAGLAYLRRNKFSLAQFWERCGVPEYRGWILFKSGVALSGIESGLTTLTIRLNIQIGVNRKAANAYLKKHYKCPKITPVKSRKAA